MEDKFITKIITLFFIAVLFVLAFLIIKPILLSIILGLFLAYIFHPVYKKINKKIKHPDFATSVLLAVIIFAIAIPIAFLIPIIIKQTFDTFVYLQSLDITAPLQKILPKIIDPEVSRSITIHFNNLTGKIFTSFLNQLANFVVNVPSFILQFVVFAFTFYFATRDSEKLKQYVANLSPFSESTEKKFLTEFRNITNAIVFGQFLIAILQGLALGVGLFILGIPHALVLTIITMIISIIPMLGPFMVWIPVAIFLFFSGSIFSGVFIVLYGAIFVSSIDNFVRPIILARTTKLPVAVGIIGIVGGLYLFGILGLVLGPLVLAYVLILLEFYREGKLNELFRK